VTKIAKELLEVADCIASCKKYADQSEVKDKYIENVVKTEQLLKAILKKYEIEEFDPTNQDYDPNLHEGLLQIPTPPGYETNKVAMVMRTGYTIKGRLLRSARVGIFS
jgi:molecular chaperone GrpE